MKKVILAAALFSFFSSVLTANAAGVLTSTDIVEHVARYQMKRMSFGEQAKELLARILIPMPTKYMGSDTYYKDKFYFSNHDYRYAAELGFKELCKEIPLEDEMPSEDGKSRFGLLECTLK